MLTYLIAGLFLVFGMGALGGAIFGRDRQRRLLLLAVAIVCWVAGMLVVTMQRDATTPATESPTATPLAAISASTPTPKTKASLAATTQAATATPVPPAVTATPTPLPDLGRLAFTSERGGNLDIWVMPLHDPAKAVQLTTDLAPDVEPVFSPDGSQILFASGRETDTGRYDLFVMNATGAKQKRLLDWPDSLEWGANWSPDGKHIAFITTRDFNWEIYVINADGSGEPVNVSRDDKLDSYSSWSPDGRWLAFVSERSGNWDIWKIDIQACLAAAAKGKGLDKACQATQLTDNLEDDFFPRWSPDGTKIAFETNREAVRDIYIMDADGGNVTRITNSLDDDSAPAWAMDGKAIVFSSRRNFDWDIYMVDADGSNERRLTHSQGEDRFIDWHR